MYNIVTCIKCTLTALYTNEEHLEAYHTAGSHDASRLADVNGMQHTVCVQTIAD